MTLLDKINHRLATESNRDDQWKLIQAKALVLADGDKNIARRMLQSNQYRYDNGLPLIFQGELSDFDEMFEFEFSPYGMDQMAKHIQHGVNMTGEMMFVYLLNNNRLSETHDYTFQFMSMPYHMFQMAKKYHLRTQTWPDKKVFAAWLKTETCEKYMASKTISLSKVLNAITVEPSPQVPWNKKWLSWSFSGKILELLRKDAITIDELKNAMPLINRLRINEDDVRDTDLETIYKILSK